MFVSRLMLCRNIYMNWEEVNDIKIKNNGFMILRS